MIKRGHLPDKSPDNINDLGPGEAWNFKVMYLGMDVEDVDSYKIAIGSGFNRGNDFAPSYSITSPQTHQNCFRHTTPSSISA